MKQHGYLVEYQLYDEFEMIRNSIKDSSLGAYWFWTGAANTATNKTYLVQHIKISPMKLQYSTANNQILVLILCTNIFTGTFGCRMVTYFQKKVQCGIQIIQMFYQIDIAFYIHI